MSGRSPGARPSWRRQLPVLAAVAAGGALGAAARHAADVIGPSAGGALPWTTFAVNATGCAAIGAFTVLSTEVGKPHGLMRPFVATGLLGGFTTFSAYAGDVHLLLAEGRTGAAYSYLVLTLLVALFAVWAATLLTRRAVRRVRRGADGGTAPDPNTDHAAGGERS